MIWLTSFYLVFHSVLNLSGELLRFADREFYYGWWNANNILEFWKTWNVPVHRFCVRHIFKPMLRAGYSVTHAQGGTLISFKLCLYSEVHISLLCKRLRESHLNFNLLQAKEIARVQLAVFAFSAFFHEYAVSVPLRVFKIYAFMGMIVQESLDSKCSLWLD